MSKQEKRGERVPDLQGEAQPAAQQERDQGQHADVGPGDGQQVEDAAADEHLLLLVLQPAAIAEDGGLQEDPLGPQRAVLQVARLDRPADAVAPGADGAPEDAPPAGQPHQLRRFAEGRQADVLVEEKILEGAGKKIPVRRARGDAGSDLDPVAALQSPAVAAAGDADVEHAVQSVAPPGEGAGAQQQQRAVVADLGEGEQPAADGDVLAGGEAQVPVASEGALRGQEGAAQLQGDGQGRAGVRRPVSFQEKQDGEQAKGDERQGAKNERRRPQAVDGKQRGQGEEEHGGENIAHARYYTRREEESNPGFRQDARCR